MSLQEPTPDEPDRNGWGREFETYLAARVDLDDVAHNGGDDHLVDGRTTRRLVPHYSGVALRDEFRWPSLREVVAPETDVAVKVCRHRIRDGGTTRRGRWILYSDELLGDEAADAVALGVYHEDLGVLDDAVTVLPTEVVLDEVVGEWSDSPHPGYEAVSRPSWASVFDPSVVDGVVDGE